jgi:hypothetical protein
MDSDTLYILFDSTFVLLYVLIILMNDRGGGGFLKFRREIIEDPPLLI